MGFDFWLISRVVLVTGDGKHHNVSHTSERGYCPAWDNTELAGYDPNNEADRAEMDRIRARQRKEWMDRITAPRTLWERSSAEEGLRTLWAEAADRHGIKHEDVVSVQVVKDIEWR